MNVYRIKEKDKESYFSTQIRNWSDTGTIFTALKAAKKALSYNKTVLTRNMRWYASNSEYTKILQESLAKLNAASIIEYNLVPVNLGTEVSNAPIAKEDPDGVELNAVEKLEKIDFSNI